LALLVPSEESSMDNDSVAKAKAAEDRGWLFGLALGGWRVAIRPELGCIYSTPERDVRSLCLRLLWRKTHGYH
jgi:hypothetical protein